MTLSISDIAKSLQLSETTVSRALSGKGRVSEQTRRRVQDFANAGGYVPNSIAQSLTASKSNTIAFLMTYAPMDDDATFFHQCLSGVCKKASSMSYDVIVVNSDKKDEIELQRLIQKRKVDGVMLNREPDHAVIAVLDKFQIPYILFGYSADEAVNQVDTDKVLAGRQLVESLINKGIKKFAYIGEYDQFIVNKRRLEGFASACADSNAASTIFTTQNMMTQDEIDSAVQAALNDAECIIAGDDLMCLRIMNYLNRADVSVPSEIKLASMYHSHLLNISVPRITGIDHKSHDVGEHAAKLMVDMLEEENFPRRGNKLVIDYKIVVGESTDIVTNCYTPPIQHPR